MTLAPGPRRVVLWRSASTGGTWRRDNAGRAGDHPPRPRARAGRNPDLLRILGYAEGSTPAGWRRRSRAQRRAGARRPALVPEPACGSADSLLRLHRAARSSRGGGARARAQPVERGRCLPGRAISFLAEGDLEGARRAVSAAPPEIDRAALVAHLAGDGNVSWLLDVAGRELLLRLTPAAFDGDEPRWADALADELWLRGDRWPERAGARRTPSAPADGYRAELAGARERRSARPRLPGSDAGDSRRAAARGRGGPGRPRPRSSGANERPATAGGQRGSVARAPMLVQTRTPWATRPARSRR